VNSTANLSTLLAITTLGLWLPMPVRADDSPALVKSTYTYKTVGDVKIQADVYRPNDTKVRPVIVWIHGGALIMGNRNSVPRNLLDLCHAEGFALVSIDYRLAPEVKLPAIIADIDDAFRWLREKASKTCHLDADGMVVTGGSAGGYLTLMVGVRIKARPQVGARVVTGSEPGLKARGRYYLYLRQNGLWTKEVTGFDPVSEKAKLDPYCPVRNVSAECPPTMLIHGTEDTDVPYSLSVDMDKELSRQNVPHELVTVTGAGHGLSGGEKKAVAAAHEKALKFIRDRLKSDN